MFTPEFDYIYIYIHIQQLNVFIIVGVICNRFQLIASWIVALHLYCWSSLVLYSLPAKNRHNIKYYIYMPAHLQPRVHGGFRQLICRKKLCDGRPTLERDRDLRRWHYAPLALSGQPRPEKPILLRELPIRGIPSNKNIFYFCVSVNKLVRCTQKYYSCFNYTFILICYATTKSR